MYRSPLLRRSLAAGLLLIVSGLPTALFAQAAPADAPKPAAAPQPAAGAPAKVAAAGRPEFPRLLPPETLAYVRVVNAPEVREEWFKTAMGQMVQDPQFKPLWDQMFTAVESAFTPVREKIGLSVNELLTLPKGELGFAVVPINEAAPAVLLLIEAPDDDANVSTLIDRGRTLLTEDGWVEESEQVGDATLNMFRRGAGNQERIIYLRRQGVLTIGNNIDAFKHLLDLWNGGAETTLADQPAFVTLERLIGKAEGAPAQISWFVDPINLVRALNARNAAAAVGMAMLPALGLDGLTALAGSFTFNRGQFEVIGQAYLLLDVPRGGVLELIALQPTETDPEPWVTDRVANYSTFTWDFERTYNKLRELVDSFAGEGTFRRQTVENLLKNIDVDLEKDLLPELDGRVSFLVSIQEPVVFESRNQLWGFHLKPKHKLDGVMKKFLDKVGDKLETKGFAGVTYYQVKGPTEEEAAQQNEADTQGRRRPRRVQIGMARPAFCLLDDCLLIGDGSAVIEQALSTLAGGSGRLADSLDYKLIASKAKRYAGEQGPGYVAFNRPDEEMRYLHGLALSEQAGKFLTSNENNRFLNDINQALADRPPPPLEVLTRYFAPGGSILVDEPTGVRFLSFVLKRDQGK
ncbi:MAG: hypothetical protein J0M17_16415 [Planctomycetes bacterium]|nr:hypothetical protein [Planctomycetota bacterium]